MDLIELSQLEHEWRAALTGKSIIAEAGIDAESALSALHSLGKRFQDVVDNRHMRWMAMSKKAIVLVGLTTVGNLHYQSGSFWPQVETAMGCDLSQSAQKTLADTFHDGLKAFGLSRFDPPLRNVGEILLHAGVPVRSLGKLLQLLQTRETRKRNLTGSDFCAWLSALSQLDAIAKGLDVPTWRFLTETGDLAEDFIDRLLRVLDALASPNIEESFAFDSLPDYVVDEVRRLVTSGDLIATERREGTPLKRPDARLVYVQQEVRLELPHLEREFETDIEWQIISAGLSKKRTVSKPWPGDIPEVLYETVNEPIANILAKVKQYDIEWKIQVVDPQLPLLVFDDQTKELLKSSAQIPKGRIWLAFPDTGGNNPLDALEYEGNLKVFSQEDPPYGWDGWSFISVDTSETFKIRPKEDKLKKAYRWKYVSSTVKPLLAVTPELPHVKDLEGGRILTARPSVILPPPGLDDSGNPVTVRWQVSVLKHDGTSVNTIDVALSGEGRSVDPWPMKDELLCGEFVLLVKGPLGRGTTFRVSLAENAQISTSTEFRWFQKNGGLEPCIVEITQDSNKTRLVLEPEHTSQTAKIGSDDTGTDLTLVIEVDHMWLMTEGIDTLAVVSLGPASIEIEELPIAVLRLNLPPNHYTNLTLRSGDIIKQAWSERSNQTGILKTSLAKIADTAQQVGVCELWIESAGRELLVALARPSKLVRDAWADYDQLRIDKEFINSDLEIGVYLELAPWKPAECVRFPPGVDTALLPSNLIGKGPKRLLARVADPWASADWPQIPQSFVDPNVLYLNDPVLPGQELEHLFIAWVATDRQELPSTPEVLAHALKIYPQLGSVITLRSIDDLYQDIANITNEIGPETLLVVGDGPWRMEDHFRLVAQGWGATAECENLEPNRNTWELSPFLGLLESGKNFQQGEEATQGFVTEFLGESAREILENGVDPLAKIGRFDKNVVWLDSQPQARIDAIWQVAAPVPGPVLDEDQRAINAKYLFDARNKVPIVESEIHTTDLLKGTHMVLEHALGREILQQSVFERSSPVAKWPSLPCVSISLAMLARLAARRHELAVRVFERRREVMVDLAVVAPHILRQDLILAELWLMFWEGTNNNGK